MHSIFTVRIRVLTTVKNQNFLLDSLKDALETPRRQNPCKQVSNFKIDTELP